MDLIFSCPAAGVHIAVYYSSQNMWGVLQCVGLRDEQFILHKGFVDEEPRLELPSMVTP